jgi:hypothetical protein
MHHAEIHLEEAPSRSITSQARLVASMPTNRDAVSRHAAAMAGDSGNNPITRSGECQYVSRIRVTLGRPTLFRTSLIAGAIDD